MSIKYDLQRYESVFYHSLHYSMVNKDEIQFLNSQFGDIAPAIKKTMEFLDRYDFDYMKDDTHIYAVACLPFILSKFDISNPDVESRKMHKNTLEFYRYMQKNRLFIPHFLNSVTNVPFYLDEEKLHQQIRIYEWFTSGKKTTKREWWSNVLQIQYLAKCVDIAWDSENDKLEFLEHFFLEFGKEVNSLTIKKQMLIACRKNPLISHTAPALKDEILNHLTYLLPKDYPL